MRSLPYSALVFICGVLMALGFVFRHEIILSEQAVKEQDPIQKLSMNASLMASWSREGVNLSWDLPEVSEKHLYRVQKSTDGFNYISIATFTGDQLHKITDPNPSAGVSFYRLEAASLYSDQKTYTEPVSLEYFNSSDGSWQYLTSGEKPEADVPNAGF